MGVFFLWRNSRKKSIYGRALILYTVHNKNLEEIIMKKKIAVLLTAALTGAFLLAGCGSKADDTAATTTDAKESVQATEEKSTEEAVAEASAEQNTENAGDKVILVVSFGTSYNDSRDITIGAIENAVTAAFPEYEVRRAFTSQIIIDKLKERDGLEIDNVEEALDRAVADGVKTLVVQPTHLMSGFEYTDLNDALEGYKDKFDQVVLADPLLSSDADYEAVAQAITAETASYDDGETAICFMGHGTEADSNADYAKLQEVLTADGFENYYIGTVEATPSVEDLINQINEAGKYKKVVLKPLMVVAGDHANNDMAGDEDDSWKSQFEAAGYEVNCIIEGLGQDEAIQNIYVSHTQAAIDSLAE